MLRFNDWEALRFFEFIVVTCSGKKGILWGAGLISYLRQLTPGQELLDVVPEEKREMIAKLAVIESLSVLSSGKPVSVELLLRRFAALSHAITTLREGDMDAREFPVISRPFLHTAIPVKVDGDEAIWTVGSYQVKFKGFVALHAQDEIPVLHLAGLTYVPAVYRGLLNQLAKELATSSEFMSSATSVSNVDYNDTELRNLTLAGGIELGLA